jgi:hypothetical protein
VANIREVTAPADLGLRPDDRAAESTANAGRRIAALYTQAGEAQADIGRRAAGVVADVGNVAVKYMEHREISQGAAESAKTLAGLDAKWNDTVKNSDPNDPAVAAKFREEVVEPALEKLKGGFFTEGGQKFGESQVESFRNHFVQKTTADMARLAGVAAKTNIETLTNQLSNAAINDPTSLKTSLGLVESSVGAMVDSSPNLRGVDGAAMKLELTASSQAAIVKAAAIGAINANPEAGLKQFSGPAYSKYISGAELKQLEAQAKTVERARRVDENYALQNQKLFKQEASDTREGDYLQKLHSDDPKERASVSAREISRDYTLTREARERMIGIVERETKPEAAAKVSNVTATDLISRIRAQSGDPRRIDSLDPVYDAYEKGNLSKADLKFVRDEFVNLRTPEGAALGNQQDEFIKSVKPLIDKSNPLLGKIDQSGPQQVYNFTMDLRRKVDEYRKAGKDPRDLMDPSKPDYMGSPAALMSYQKPLQQSLQDTARALRGGSGFPAADTITGVQNVPQPAATSVPRPPAAKPPEKGFVKDGYEFLGGNPGDAGSWRKVGA